ncbi:MAG: hypothetical protein K2M01_00600, partial [Paramuribaculum sp.]|nr:hypothetical protein [Paramuribaculum sp.]
MEKEKQKTLTYTKLKKLLRGLRVSVPEGPRRYNLMINLGTKSTVPYNEEYSGACEWQEGFNGDLHVGDVVYLMGGHYTIPTYMPNGGTTMLLPGGDEYVVSAKGFYNGIVYLLRHEDVGGGKSKEMIITNGEATIQYAETSGAEIEQIPGLDTGAVEEFGENTDIRYIINNEYEGLDDPALSKAISKRDAITIAGITLMEANDIYRRYGGRVIIAGDDCVSAGRPLTSNQGCWIKDSEGRYVMLLYGDVVIADGKPFRYLGTGIVTSQQWEGEYIEEYREAAYNVTEQSGGQIS